MTLTVAILFIGRIPAVVVVITDVRGRYAAAVIALILVSRSASAGYFIGTITTVVVIVAAIGIGDALIVVTLKFSKCTTCNEKTVYRKNNKNKNNTFI